MKNILTTLLLLVMYGSVEAQHFAIGVRSGTSYWMRNNGAGQRLKSAEGQTMTWDKGLSLRVGKKRLVFETSLTHYSFNNMREVFMSEVNEKRNNVDWSLGAQYSFAGRNEKTLRHFIGLAIIPSVRFEKTTGYSYDDLTGKVSMVNRKNRSYSIWAGLSYAMAYNVTKRFFLSSELSFKVQPGSFFSSLKAFPEEPDSRAGMNVGVGYLL